MMKVAISTPGKFHAFDLARELHTRNALSVIFSAYPGFKLRYENIPREKIKSFSLTQAPLMALPWGRWLHHSLIWEWKHLNSKLFDAYVAQKLPECDLFVGMSGSAIQSGKRAHQLGARFVCDRGSAHVRTQYELLLEEHERWGIPLQTMDSRTIDKEEAEYAEADCITVPSTFALNTFIEKGTSVDKLRVLPYGVNLERFKTVAQPNETSFDVLYVGGMTLQKGIQYLTQAFQNLCHPNKSLTFVGTASPQLIALLKQRGMWSAGITVSGHVPQVELKKVMSRSHVLVLPSIQDGFGMVMAQAMACGCPVIASENTGAADLFTDGKEGFIVPIRDVGELTERLQRLADNPKERVSMGQHALMRVQGLGGWHSYGEKAMAIYDEVLQK
jgi:glycosyltransferase involved in cell wall biosynthesis